MVWTVRSEYKLGDNCRSGRICRSALELEGESLELIGYRVCSVCKLDGALECASSGDDVGEGGECCQRGRTFALDRRAALLTARLREFYDKWRRFW